MCIASLHPSYAATKRASPTIPLILARRADDFCAERLKEAVQLVVGTLASAKAEMMQADALLFERRAFMLG
jgi:hypothetical protein